MKTWFRFFCCLWLLFSARNAAALNDIEVVSLNQYLGADLTPVLNAPIRTHLIPAW